MSRAESLLSLVNRLDDDQQRRALGLYKVERFGAFVSAMDTGAEPVGLVVSSVLAQNALVQMLIRRAEQRGVPVLDLPPERFRTHARGARASGIIAILRQPWLPIEEVTPTGAWVAVDQIRSKGNLGCILRTCEACGVEGLIVVGHQVDPFDPDVVSAAMTGISGLKFTRVSRAGLVRWSERHKAPIVGTSPRGTVAWDQFAYPSAMVLWLGDERQGLAADALARCATTVSIPILGRADSLNVATAAGIVLYEALRQRRSDASAGSILTTPPDRGA